MEVLAGYWRENVGQTSFWHMCFRKMNWSENDDLKKCLKTYVQQNLKRKEILDFMCRDFSQYRWSLATLDRRLRFFGIHYIERDTGLSVVTKALEQEMQGPGKLLGYRSMNQKLRTEYGICVPRKIVYDTMWELNPEGVESRCVKRKKKIPKRPFSSDGPNWTFSLDGHDKMMGFQKSTFPLAIYGCQDTFSRKIVFLRVWNGNSDPKLVASFFLQHLTESRVLPHYLRLDRGNETGLMATIHCYLHQKLGTFQDETDAVIYGPSTANKIERWWRDLHHRMEKDIKAHLLHLLASHSYDPHNQRHRIIMSYLVIPILQRECDTFVRIWNSHRIRKQQGVVLPC